MPRNFIKKLTPSPDKIRDHKHMRIFRKWLHNGHIWHLNRRSVGGAFSVGLFCSFVPIPFQMVLAAAVAILLRVNLPLSVALVWISNPLTMPVMFYGAYKVGVWVLAIPTQEFNFELSFEWLANELAAIWAPFLLGCFICGAVLAIVGNIGIRLLWRLSIVRHHRERKNRKK